MRGFLLNYQYGMWDSVLQLLKTNTRREGSLEQINKDPDNHSFKGFFQPPGSKNIFAEFTHIPTGQSVFAMIRYRPGDYAYLQEPIIKTPDGQVIYKYTDKNGCSEAETFKPLVDRAISSGAAWENKYFMAAEHARYYVYFKNYPAVQRLTDISNEDCKAEGIKSEAGQFFYTKDGIKKFFPSAQKAYFSLYNEINKGGKKAENPWLFSYYFTLCPKP